MATKTTSFLVWTTLIPAAFLIVLCVISVTIGEVPWYPMAGLVIVLVLAPMTQYLLDFGEKVFMRRMYRKIFENPSISNAAVDMEIAVLRRKFAETSGKWGAK